VGNRVNQDGSAARVPSFFRYFFTSLSHPLALTLSHPLTFTPSRTLSPSPHSHPPSLTFTPSHLHLTLALTPSLSLLPPSLPLLLSPSFIHLSHLVHVSLTCEPLYRFRLLRNRACGLTCVSLCTMV